MDAKHYVSSFKRKGKYDARRKDLYQKFQQSQGHEELIKLIQDKINSKITEDPKLLSQNKGKVSGLITGDLYKDSLVNQLIEDAVKEALGDKSVLSAGIKQKLEGIEKAENKQVS